MITRLRISFLNLMTRINYQSIWSFVLINLSASLVLCALATTIGDAFEIDRAETAGRLASIIWPLNLAFCFGASLVASAVWLLWEYMRAIMAVRWQARFAKAMPKFVRRLIALLGLILVGFLLIYIRDMFENYFANVITMIELLERASWTDVLSRIIFRWLVPTFAWLFLIGITLFPKMKESLFYSIGSRKIIYVTAITMFLSWAGTTIRVPVSSELVITNWNSVSIDPTALSEAVVNFEDQQGGLNNSLFDPRVYEISGNSFGDVNQFNFRSNDTFINKIKNQSSMISYSIVNNDQKSVKYTYQGMTEPENISFLSKDAYCDHHVILRFFSTPGFPTQMERLPDGKLAVTAHTVPRSHSFPLIVASPLNDGRPLSLIDNRMHIQKWTSQRSDEPKLAWFNSKSYIAAKGKYVSTSSDHGIQFSFEPSYIEVILPASCIEIRGKSALALQTERRSRSGAGNSFMPLMFVSLKTKLESKLVFDLPAYSPFEVPTNWWPMQLTGDRQAAAFLSNSLTGTVFTNGEARPIVPGQSVMLSNITSMNSTKEHIRFNTRSGDSIVGGHMQSKRLISYLTGEYWAAFATFFGAFIAYLQWRRR